MPVAVERIDPFEHLEAVYEVYCRALEEPPDAPGPLAWRRDTLPRHAQRDDFEFLVARDDHDRVSGFTYGYSGRYGQWWTDRVAAAMDEQTRREWLDPPHFEIVELHVRPERQRHGIGSRLLGELLARQPHDRAVLTANPRKPQPLPFYTKHGWRALADVRWTPDALPMVVLGKRV